MQRTFSPALAATAEAARAIPGVPVAAIPDTVRWGPCPEKAASPRLACSALDFPLDHRDRDGRHVEVLSRHHTGTGDRDLPRSRAAAGGDTGPGIDWTLLRGITFDRLHSDAAMALPARTWRALATDRPLSPSPPSADLDNATSAGISVFGRPAAAPDAGRVHGRHRTVRVLAGRAGRAPVRIGDPGPSNMLMVHNKRDPGTPRADAQKLRRAFGERATLVTAGQGGHGICPFGRTTCANDTVSAFPTAGQRPTQDLACAAEPSK